MNSRANPGVTCLVALRIVLGVLLESVPELLLELTTLGDVAHNEDGHAKERIDARLFGNPLQRRRWLKHYIYPKMPAKWLARFVWMYFFRLGFLDGIAGFRFCLFMSTYELLIMLKLEEMRIARKERAREARV